MSPRPLPIPGVVLGSYPERRQNGWIGRDGAQSKSALSMPSARKRARRYQQFVNRVQAFDSTTTSLPQDVLQQRLKAVRACFARHGLADLHVTEAFMLIKRTCARELGIELFPTQMMAARIMLDGHLAEMSTGEGKTVAAAICAATAALAGVPVHLITANDYLVERDAALLRPLYAALGLSVAAVTQNVPHDERRNAYACNVVYTTASELAFDYLRDSLVRSDKRNDLQQRVLRLGSHAFTTSVLLKGLCMALIDEADSVLIDDARVPLVLSEHHSNRAERSYLNAALDLAVQLTDGTHFKLDPSRMCAELTSSGRTMLDQSARDMQSAWRNRMHREETVATALAALHLYKRDREYLVNDCKVSIIDQSTGRVARGRVWSRGLHQLIELKEGCPTTGETVTLAQITYQRFFQRYLLLGGMSGTLREARAELLSVYGLQIVPVPLNRPDRRKILATALYRDSRAHRKAVVSEVLNLTRSGRPVLIGTDSVAESEAFSACLSHAGARHTVLNARQDTAEADVIRRAGERGRITVATNMAGRGTDIALGPGVAELGGLHVICCQANRARRIDRQLAGRCARQGDPGSARSILCVDQTLSGRRIPKWIARVIPAAGAMNPQWLIRGVVWLAQWLEERHDRAARRALWSQDMHADRNLSFGRPAE